MAKGKKSQKKKQKQEKQVINEQDAQRKEIEERIRSTAQKVDKTLAVQRLTQLFTSLSGPPETVLQMLDRLEIEYSLGEAAHQWDGDDCDTQYVMFRVADMEEGEKLNKSLAKRIYGDDIRIEPES